MTPQRRSSPINTDAVPASQSDEEITLRTKPPIIATAIALFMIISATACIGISEADHTDALNKQALAAQQQLQEALEEQAGNAQLELDRNLSQHAADLAAKDDAISAAQNRSSELETAIQTASENNQQLTAERDTTFSELEFQSQNTRDLKAHIARARTETRWINHSFPNNDGSTTHVVTSYVTDPTESDRLGLAAYCDKAGNYLYLLTEFAWEDDATYVLRVGFDGAPMRNEDLWGFGDTFPGFAELNGNDLWRAKTITIGRAGTPPLEFTFDTDQLQRMYPDSQAFCDGESPKER